MPLTDNLAAYWKLDAAGILVDATGTVTDLTNNNAVGSGTGIINECGDFESGSSQCLSHASVAALQAGDVDFEIQAWVKLESEPANGMIFTKDSNTGSKREYQLWYRASDDRFVFRVFDAAASAVVVVANNHGAVSTGVWYFIHAWHDAAANEIGISVDDGTPDTQATGGALQAASDGTFAIGGQDFGGFLNFFDGLIDECGLWKRVLTGAERTSLYNAGAGLAYPFSGTSPPNISYAGSPYSYNVGDSANATVTNTGDAATFAVVSGSLPTGATLNSSTGAITGTLTAGGTFTPTIRATNAGGTSDATPTFNVLAAPDISYTTPVSLTVDVAMGTLSPTNSGGASTNWTVDSGALPSGVSLNATTGAITGTPDTIETTSAVIKATNAAGNDTFEIDFDVHAAPVGGSRNLPTPGLNSGPYQHFVNRTMANAMHNVGGMPIEGG